MADQLCGFWNSYWFVAGMVPEKMTPLRRREEGTE
jgi:hypothetical protein